jgi:hypothetical protein
LARDRGLLLADALSLAGPVRALFVAAARALADRLDPEHDRDGATARLLDCYQHTAGPETRQVRRSTDSSAQPATTGTSRSARPPRILTAADPTDDSAA